MINLLKKLPFFLFPLTLLMFIFGNRVPYLNILQGELLKVLCTVSIISVGLVYKKVKWFIWCISLLVTVYSYLFQRSEVLWPLLISFILIPELSWFHSLWKRFHFNLSFYKKWFWPFLVSSLSIGIFFFYRHSFQSYFEGDEWVFLRTFAPMVQSRWWFLEGFLQVLRDQEGINFHMTPIATLFYIIEFHLFGLHFEPYIFVSLLLHLLTSIVFCIYVFILSNSRKTALYAAIIFGLSTVHFEAITWIMTALYTQFVVLFGFLSQIFLLRSFKRKNKNDIILSSVFLLCALWSKETAIVFLGLTVFTLIERKLLLRKGYIHGLGIVLLLFVATQLFGHRAEIHQLFDGTSSNQPWVYSTLLSIQKLDIPLFFYRSMAFFLKTLAQSVLPSEFIKQIGIAITDNQFPFFNAEKSVRGTTYMSFINSVPPEFISYIVGFAMLMLMVVYRSGFKNSVTNKGLFLWVFGSVPIILILFQFPWWGYSAYIDSRHFYHVVPGLALVTAIILNSFSNKKACVCLAIFLIIQYHYTQHSIFERQKAAHSEHRRVMITTLIRDIQPVPKKLIIYTTSNKSFYGFGYWMLPFQIAFSHIMPVFLSKPYHTQGLVYPETFYTQAYMKDIPGGLVTQGIHQDGEYLLGYFLEMTPLIKALEKHQLPLDIVYTFDYNGDNSNFKNTTQEKRAEIAEILKSREVFKSWKRTGSKEEKLSFAVPSDYVIEKKNTQYLILHGGVRIFSIEVIENTEKVQFSQFVKSEEEKQTSVVQLSQLALKTDLDIDRVQFISDDKRLAYTVAGNNLMFYKLQIFRPQEFDLILRTFEFIDQPDEEISF